ncbi:DEAH-box ATP-dependent RNA helicase prp22 [Pestalotiopsis sp. IQ-011]
MCSSDIFLGLLAIIFPPLPVWIKCGICSADSIINILLCMLAYIPGLLHAWYIIAKVPDDYEYSHVPDAERGHQVIVIHGDGRQQQQQQTQQPQRQPKPQPKSQNQAGMNYGTARSQGNGSSSTAAQAGSSAHNEHEPAPPSYADAVRGDHKVQTHE